MLNVDKIYNTFLSLGVDFFTGVPDSLLNSICAYIADNAPKEKNIIAANEGAAVGIAAGYYMASGKLPLIYMQNSGLGNAINPLLSLADEKVYSLPLLLMIGWRGEPGVKDEPQHIKQGEVTLELLQVMQIPYIILDLEEEIAREQIATIAKEAKNTNKPHAIIVRKDTFSKYKLNMKMINNYFISREEALKLVIDHLSEDAVVVSTTGKLSRELFEYRELRGNNHVRDFLTVGSMGHSSSIAFGLAIERSERNIYCLDGDGAFIMHMGAISNIGNSGLRNYKHILFNNGAHESVGGQPTLGFQLDILAIAKACGYKEILSVETKEELLEQIVRLEKLDGPVLLEIKVKIESRDGLGRPSITPIENKELFMENLG